MKIFVSIASYRDPLLATTVREAYENACYKDSLVFGIVDQSYGLETFDPNYFLFKKQIRYVRVDPHLARGACWARHLVQTLYNCEEYYFQIDSHTIFDQDWDKKFIEQHQHLQQYHAMPIISSYPYSFEIVDGDLTNLKKTTRSPDCQVLIVNTEHTFKNANEKHVSSKGTYYKKQEPVHASLVAGGCLFGDGHLVERVPYDPNLYFTGEECSLALRLWTNGYNLFHMPDMPLYHQYIGKYRNKHWADKIVESASATKWHEMSTQSRERVHRVTTGKNLGVYGIGNKRTLQQYADFSGIDYVAQTYTERNISELDYRNKI